MDRLKLARAVIFIFFGIGAGSMILSGFFKLTDGEFFDGALRLVSGLLLTALGVKAFRSDFLRD
ncbi:hypothetical protein [Kocuria rosea]|uniref:hypothetical protein n=1 Tax=Kocuria rosea TaxID=1275 RepID=UPI0011A2FDC9|nr:hypothetical protein [Kocuria rosea]